MMIMRSSLSTRTPSLLTLTTTSLLFLAGSSIAQINSPDCSLAWKWSFNSLGQNACTVAAYLMATCNGGAFTISALQPGYSYTGPSGIDDGNLCKCNTITYSLISACDACQGETWTPWTEYSFNCTKVMPPSTFPNAVPSGTRVPQWALLDITPENSWNASTSFTIGDTPEIAPGAILSPSGSSTSSPSISSSTSSSRISSTSTIIVVPTPTPAPSGSKSNTGAIAGGVVGGIAAIAIAGLAVFFWQRRRKPQAPSSAFAGEGTSGVRPHSSYYQAPPPPMGEFRPPMSDDGTFVTPGTPPMKIYDPNDPTTFPGYQPSSEAAHVPYIGNGNGNGSGTFNSVNTLANMQTSRPQGGGGGYHGLPTV